MKSNILVENFYRITRPFGFWGPLESAVSEETKKQMKTESRNDLIALPFAFFWIVSMFMIPVLFLIHNFNALMLAVLIFLVSVGGLYQFWYKNLPPAENRP